MRIFCVLFIFMLSGCNESVFDSNLSYQKYKLSGFNTVDDNGSLLGTWAGLVKFKGIDNELEDTHEGNSLFFFQIKEDEVDGYYIHGCHGENLPVSIVSDGQVEINNIRFDVSSNTTLSAYNNNVPWYEITDNNPTSDWHVIKINHLNQSFGDIDIKLNSDAEYTDQSTIDSICYRSVVAKDYVDENRQYSTNTTYLSWQDEVNQSVVVTDFRRKDVGAQSIDNSRSRYVEIPNQSFLVRDRNFRVSYIDDPEQLEKDIKIFVRSELEEVETILEVSASVSIFNAL